MTPRFVFHPAARDELREARDWYEVQRVGLGDDLGDVVTAALIVSAVCRSCIPRWRLGYAGRCSRGFRTPFFIGAGRPIRA